MDLSKSLSSLQDLALEKEREKKQCIFNIYHEFTETLNPNSLPLFHNILCDMLEQDEVDSNIMMFFINLYETWRSY